MASVTSGHCGGSDRDQNTNKKHPLIHDQLHQLQKQQQHHQSTDPNVFSIDRTFSASSTDIQPSFDVFEDDDDEDDSSNSDRHKKTSRGEKSKTGGGHNHHNYQATSQSRRPNLCRKDMAFHRHREEPPPNNQHASRLPSNYSHHPSSGGGGGYFNANSRLDNKVSDVNERSRSYYIEGEDSSIGVPSDISGMLQDSEVMEDGEKGNSSSNNSSALPNSNESNDHTKILNQNFNSADSMRLDQQIRGNGDCIPPGDNNSIRNGGTTDSSSSDQQGHESSGKRVRKNIRSSVISDGKFGSVSVSSSFNSAAAAAIASGYPGNNNNDIFNERLERFQRYTRGPYAPLDRCNSTSVSSAHSSTITQHYYPEGGWGYVVLATAAICHALMCGLHLSAGIFILEVLSRFGEDLIMSSVWMVSFSMGASLLLSPLWVSICQRRSTRLTAVFGGLVTSLAYLFTSFASQFHQTFISFGIILSIGIGLSRDAAYLMVGQYFKRRRDFVEVFLVAASGFGILVMTLAVHVAVSGLGWRFGLQALTAGLFSTFFLGTCYRSASLYHPQRRAILHLKNQKRKIKEKGKRTDRPPFFDSACLSSRSLQLIVLSTAFSSFGSYSPLFYLTLECSELEMPTVQMIYFYLYIGAGWMLGSCLFGMTVVQRNEDCRISKPYLLQGSTLIIGGALLALATLHRDHGLGGFCWIYGFGLGSYNYVLKAWTYEKARAKNFSSAWSFVQCAQGFGCIFGVPATGYMNYYAGWRSGYFLSSATVFLSALLIFCFGMRRRRLMRNKSGTSSMKTCETFDSSGMQSPTVRRISFTFPDEQISPRLHSKGSNRSGSSGLGISAERQSGSGSINSCNGNSSSFSLTHHHQQQQPLLLDQPQGRMPKELTCISEEGILEPHGPV